MIPHLNPRAELPPRYREFLDALASDGFSGEIQLDYATRLVAATDNSVYQLLPKAVLFPRSEADVCAVLRLASEGRFASIKLSPRGGGTGTNGQSLTDGIIVDVSRHMSAILETNLDEMWVRVQPGVVLDELNAHLKPHGVFFAPNLSPSNRATIGGMVNTDASGKGSRVYGKTSQHVLELRAVLTDGEVLRARPLDPAELEREKRKKDLTGSIFRTVDEIVTTHADAIATTLPKMARFLTGYDLAHVRRPDGRFDLTSVLCGSEGTLSVITEAKLRLTKLPTHRTLVAIRYADFDSALRAANVLVRAGPGAIETVDDTIVELARGDVIWEAVAHLVEQRPDEPKLAAINLVEFESDDPAVVARKVEELCRELDASVASGASLASAASDASGAPAGYTVVRAPKDIAALWTLRKKGVGLLGNAKGDRRPIPFVEDTAVPPDHLADYIREFRAILDRHGLRYGMFGHVDVGCLHVRPALDMRDEDDERLLRAISDEVVALVKRHGGVIWGEHGKGFRSEYTPVFFGPELYAELRRVKEAFDPRNQINPGKIATPASSKDELVSVDAVKRGRFDRQIHPLVRARFETTVQCNGNGACFDWSPDSVMCPSSKVTRDRIHSPKGRAGIMREWLRLLARAGHDAGVTRPEEVTAIPRAREREPDDFSHEVYDAMNGCLACKACATQCPIKVDVPQVRSEFLAQYHQRYRRPLKDYFVAVLEVTLMVMGRLPRLFNRSMALPWVKRLLERIIGIVDVPPLAESTLAAGLRARGAPSFDPIALAALSEQERARTVLVAQDAFTTFYEPNVALAVYDVLVALGRRVVFLPFHENGKGLHIKGFLRRFERVASRSAAALTAAAKLGIPIVGIEPAVTLTYRDEYVHALGARARAFEVKLLQEYLSGCLSELTEAAKRVPAKKPEPASRRLRLFGHCTEKTAASASQAQWQKVFAALGAEIDLATTGCCGMCGVFGHEAEHVEESRGVFEMSWKKALPAGDDARARALVTGHSCRHQVERFAGLSARHPIEALRDVLLGG